MNLRQFTQALLAIALSSSSLLAVPLMQDLGQGLRYIRISSLPADIPGAKQEDQVHALILDMRGSLTDASGIGALSAWLNFRKASDIPVIVLLNSDTETKIAQLATDTDWPALVALSPNGGAFTPDVRVDTDMDTDRKACEAIARGEPLANLIATKVTKERLDEAKLAKTYESNGRITPREIEEPKKASPTPSKEHSSQAADLVLARAVQLHRTMTALRMIP